jgi:hypothetical protein
MRWTGNDGGNPNWDLVLDAVASDCQLDRAQLAHGLRSMGPRLEAVLERGAELGIEPSVLQFLTPNIANQAAATAKIN